LYKYIDFNVHIMNFTSNNVYKWQYFILITNEVQFNYNLSGDRDPDGDLSSRGTGMGKKCPPQAFVGIPVGKFFCRGDGFGELKPDGEFPVAIPSRAACIAMCVRACMDVGLSEVSALVVHRIACMQCLWTHLLGVEHCYWQCADTNTVTNKYIRCSDQSSLINWSGNIYMFPADDDGASYIVRPEIWRAGEDLQAAEAWPPEDGDDRRVARARNDVAGETVASGVCSSVN
jgi:hypothetical protein